MDKARASVDKRREAGDEFDNAHLLLGGDSVTNEAIYDEQPYDIDATMREQIDRAVSSYMEELEMLSDEFDFVQVVAQGGNHGEFRVKGSSKDANADDIMYDQLENLAEYSGFDNVKFIKSDRADFVNFDVRGHKGHLRHGDNVRNHIGTSSPKSDWEAFLNEYGFDIAFRGHYHEMKRENVHGSPVFMGPSQKPAGEFAGEIGEFSDDELIGYLIYSSDEAVVEGVEDIRLD